jgi:hypothetical protein
MIMRVAYETGAVGIVVAAWLQLIPAITAIIALAYWGSKFYFEVWPKWKEKMKKKKPD